MFIYMNYPVSVWLCVDSSPDKVVHGYIHNKHRVPWPQRKVMWNGILVAERENYYHFLIMLTCAWEAYACFLLISSFSLTEKVLTLHQFGIIFFLINPSVLWICTWYRYKIECSRLNDQWWNFLLGLLRILQSDLCRRKFTLTWMCEFKVQQKCCVW